MHSRRSYLTVMGLVVAALVGVALLAVPPGNGALTAAGARVEELPRPAEVPVKGPIELHEKPTGRKILRFNALDRAVHWATAISFVILAVSGLIMFFGKGLLLPLIGYTLFSWLATLSKNLHNFVGPLFIVCIVLIFVNFVPYVGFALGSFLFVTYLRKLAAQKRTYLGLGAVTAVPLIFVTALALRGGRVIERVKGGLAVDVGGVKAGLRIPDIRRQARPSRARSSSACSGPHEPAG